MSSSSEQLESVLNECIADMDALYERCAEAAPDYGVSREDFRAALRGSVEKHLLRHAVVLSAQEIREFLDELEVEDLYLALGCARQNEHAWSEFRRRYRRDIERSTLALSYKSATGNPVELVYLKLCGNEIGDFRQSEFQTYTGFGTLRLWLRRFISRLERKHGSGARYQGILVGGKVLTGGRTGGRPAFRAKKRKVYKRPATGQSDRSAAGAYEMSQPVTLEVSGQVVRQAAQVAAQTERSIEEVLSSWLESAVTELPVEWLADDEVIALTRMQLTDAQQATLSELLRRSREGALDTAGEKQLDELMRLYEHSLLRKSQALRVAVQRELIAPLQA